MALQVLWVHAVPQLHLLTFQGAATLLDHSDQTVDTFAQAGEIQRPAPQRLQCRGQLLQLGLQLGLVGPRGGELFFRDLSLRLGGRLVGLLLVQLPLHGRHIVGEQTHSGITDIGLDSGGPLGHLRLSAQRFELAAQLPREVGQPLQVLLDLLQLAQGLLFAAAVLQNPGRLFDEPAAILWTGVQDGVEATLTDNDVHLTADTGVGQQLLDVEQATGLPVDRVLGTAAAEQRSPDRHLCVVDRQRAVAVVDGQFHLGTAQWRLP